MTKKTVYLAGTMVGNTVEYCRTWREHATKILENSDFKVLDPLRGLELEDSTVITADTEASKCRELFARDLSDVGIADIILAVFTGASTGTGFELGYAYCITNYLSEEKRLVVVSPERHPFLVSCADYFTSSLDDALEYIVKKEELLKG